MELPNELLIHVCSYIPINELAEVRSVCTVFENEWWRRAEILFSSTIEVVDMGSIAKIPAKYAKSLMIYFRYESWIDIDRFMLCMIYFKDRKCIVHIGDCSPKTARLIKIERGQRVNPSKTHDLGDIILAEPAGYYYKPSLGVCFRHGNWIYLKKQKQFPYFGGVAHAYVDVKNAINSLLW